MENLKARDELVEISKKLFGELDQIKRTNKDDAFDYEYKRGLRQAFGKSIALIQQRLEELEDEK